MLALITEQVAAGNRAESLILKPSSVENQVRPLGQT